MIQTGGETQTRCGFAAIIGPPNAGKSTLINALVGAKVTIVSRKVQTTRNIVRGIITEGQSQIVLVDTPGLFSPGKRLERAMVQAAWQSAMEADCLVLILDAGKPADDRAHQSLIDEMARRAKTGTRCILVLNKIDCVKKDDLLPRIAAYNDRFGFDATYLLSALRENGLDDLRADLATAMPESPWLFDADMISDAPLRFLAAEVTREEIYDKLHEELPYAIAVHTEGWHPGRNGRVEIEQIIYVKRPGQKKIVLGQGGKTIKAIGTQARKALEDILQQRVHLDLYVKVRENWDERQDFYSALGLDFHAG